MATETFQPKIFHTSKLDRSNFSFWKFQLKLILENHGLIELVERNNLLPTAIVLLADNSNNAEVTTRDSSIKNWKQRDITARNFIVSSLDEKYQRTLMTSTTAACGFDSKLNMSSTLHENKHLLMAKFMSYENKQGNNVMSHITAIEKLATGSFRANTTHFWRAENSDLVQILTIYYKRRKKWASKKKLS
jgi:hypothetical protein